MADSLLRHHIFGIRNHFFLSFHNISPVLFCISRTHLLLNDYNLNVPRYIDKYIPEKLPPITEIVKGIQKTEKEIHKTEKELCGMLKQMYGTTNEAQKELNEVICMWEEILNGN